MHYEKNGSLAFGQICSVVHAFLPDHHVFGGRSDIPYIPQLHDENGTPVEAVTIAKLAASYLDGDELVRYSITRERDEEYDRLEAILDNIKEQSGVLYLYVVKPVSEDSTVYLFDAAAANETNYLAKLGDRGDWNENF